MTRRLHHFLTPAKGDTYPFRLVALDVDAVSRAVPGHEGLEREELRGWCAVGWDTSSRGVRRSYTGRGTTRADWWDTTRWALKRGGRTWVVAHCASRVWALVGLWGLIERGELRLTGEDVRDGTNNAGADQVPVLPDGDAGTGTGQRAPDVRGVRQVRPGRSADAARRGAGGAGGRGAGGFVVLEDPPSVASVRSPGLPGQLILVDGRNYGLEAAPAGLDCAGRAAWLADVMRRVIDTLRDNRLGSLQVTAGSQALYSLRRSHLTHTMHCHTNQEALALERAAYVGGRCECRRIGVVPGPVYHLDFRSLYGSICACSHLPALLYGVGMGCPPGLSGVRDGACLLSAEVTVGTDEPAYPVRRNGLVVYPTGRFVTTLCGPELTDAQAHGRIVHWHRWATYVGLPCLASYAGCLLALLGQAREAGDSPLCQFLKLLIVSIVGKMGQRDWRWVGAPDFPPPGPWQCWPVIERDGSYHRARSIGWQVQTEQIGDWAPNAVPAVAAWVCSLGRVALLNAIRTAGWSEVYYHDTDSLIVSELGYYRLESAGVVGCGESGILRVVGCHQHAEIRGIKHYMLDGARKCSGAPGGTAERAADEQRYWFRKWLKRAVRDGVRPEAERELRTWDRLGAYRHGVVGPDGRVKPWNVES